MIQVQLPIRPSPFPWPGGRQAGSETGFRRAVPTCSLPEKKAVTYLQAGRVWCREIARPRRGKTVRSGMEQSRKVCSVIDVASKVRGELVFLRSAALGGGGRQVLG